MSRNFVGEWENEQRRTVTDNTFVRRTIGGSDDENNDDTPLSSSNKNNNNNADNASSPNSPSSSPRNSGRVDLPDEEQTKLYASSSSGWWKKSTQFATEHKKQLQVGIFALVMIICLVVLADVASKSGQTPDAIMPRLLFFMVDGVTVQQFKETASARRTPSMDFFTAQSENCRPEIAIDSSFTHPYDRCVLSDPSSHTGTIFSLLTGANFIGHDQETGKALTLHDVQKYNFATFLRQATKRGLTSAVFGNSPILTVSNPQPPSASNPSPRICGILDTECVLTAEAEKQALPACTVPSKATDPLSAMITKSSSCNVAFQSLILDTDSPDQIWARVKHVLAQDADVVFVQIPENTFNQWKRSHELENNNNNNIKKSLDAVNSEFAFDAALYQADKLFSKILRDIAVRSAEEGEEWLSLLAISSAEKEPDLVLASNIIKNGQREDVQMLLDSPMKKMTPDRLSAIINEWLMRE